MSVGGWGGAGSVTCGAQGGLSEAVTSEWRLRGAGKPCSRGAGTCMCMSEIPGGRLSEEDQQQQETGVRTDWQEETGLEPSPGSYLQARDRWSPGARWCHSWEKNGWNVS